MPGPSDTSGRLPEICQRTNAAYRLLAGIRVDSGVAVADNQVQRRSPTVMRQAAADELAARLKELADKLAATGKRPKRVPYGRDRVGGVMKRRSPRGFVLDPVAPHLLLPDGRLWHYHSRRSPEGIYYDARVDHGRSMHGPIPLADERFSFLGAVVDKYSFGYLHGGGELGAIAAKGDLPHWVCAAEAFAEIADNL